MIKRVWMLILMAAVVGCHSVRAGVSDICAEPVATGSGQVRGMSEKASAACVWRGIPYAAPPVGERRWQSPAPMPAWSGVREATRWGNRCMQKGIFKLEALEDGRPFSEDCLYLNIWRPKKGGTFPVMFWVHGGGYTGGAGNTPMYYGDRLAAAGDVVVVTFNYRLNVFGFFAHPEQRAEDPHQATGGQGSLDQVAALRWVHDNIKNFGGDPDNVTIFGESAGGFSICTLLATPLTKDLFHRAIMESGGCNVSADLEPGFKFAEDTAPKFGCRADDLACLRRVPAKELLEKASGGMGGPDHVPHHDGYLLSGTPLSMIQSGNYNHVPFIAGTNRDEFGGAMKLKSELRKTPPSNYVEELGLFFKLSPEEARELAALYPLSEFNNRPVVAFGRMFGVDAAMACPTYDAAVAAAGRQPEVYLYRFDYDEMALGKYTGALHSYEIPFVFDNLDRMPMNLLYHRKNLVAARPLQKIIQGYWLNFAKTGDPNGPGLPVWPRFNPAGQLLQVLDTNPRAQPAGISNRCAFWGRYSQKHHSALEIMGKKSSKE